jgi:16S rRNA (guanine1516-N2)-methyltransferase
MDIKQDVRIKLETDDPAVVAHLENLALGLGLEPPSVSIGDCPFYLRLRNDRLELHSSPAHVLGQAVLTIDFLSGPTYYRYLHDRRISQPLAKAVGIKRGFRPTIADATAGFGEDCFVLAALGCRVTMIERSPLICALLKNAIARCSTNPRVASIFEHNVTLLPGDSRVALTDANQQFDTIYLDPMYPMSQKSALNKQRMRLLRELVGDDHDDAELLHISLKRAARRVAVKRPAKAPFLAALEPSYSLRSKSSRFDIYLTNHL